MLRPRKIFSACGPKFDIVVTRGFSANLITFAQLLLNFNLLQTFEMNALCVCVHVDIHVCLHVYVRV